MTHDVIVIGGSYAGLSAAMQLARARKRVLVIDAGLPRNRFAHEGHGFFGQDGRPPFDILLDARGQLAAYPTITFAAGKAVRCTLNDTDHCSRSSVRCSGDTIGSSCRRAADDVGSS